MSWAWLLAYVALLVVSWDHLSVGWATAFTNIGVGIFLVMMISLVREPIALHWLRNAFDGFWYAFERDGLWNHASPETAQRLQVLQETIRWFGRWLLPFSRRR